MKGMNIYDKIKRSMDLDDPRRQNVELMEKYIERIPTEAGKKYALSKLLNDPKYGMTDPTSFKNQNFINDIKDAWSLKYQDDYTPPDIEKTLSKANKEQAENFWNWDSDEHWTKRGTDELKRQADRAGYGDNLAGYLDKVRELQTNKDREKLYDENAMPGTKLLLPRMTEAVQRGEDPSTGDKVLDGIENAMYLLNPVGRVFKAWAQGARAGKYLGRVANVADNLANPLIMESLDAGVYGDEDNTDRKDFSKGDVAIGTGINVGMNKLIEPLLKKGLRNVIAPPVQKSKAQIKAEQEAKLATEEANKVIEDGTSREAKERMKDIVQDELQRQRIRDKFASAEDKRELLQQIKEQLTKKKVVEPRKTKFSERLLGDLDKWAGLDYVSNKAGDAISEDPKLTRQLLTKSVRSYLPMAGQFVSDLARDYYNRKDKNVEQEKINRDLKSLKLLGGRK